MNIQRTKNTKKNVFWGTINKFVTLLFPYLIRTIMIRTLGADYLGLNSLFASILQVLNLTELGFSSAIIYSLYKPIAQNNEELLCALLNLYRKIYKYIGFIILALGLLLLPFLNYFIQGTIPLDINIYVIYIIYLFNTFISYELYAYKNSILCAYQRNDVISNINTITQSLMYFAQIVVLLYIKNYYIYIIFMPLSTMLNNLIISSCCNKIFPQIKCKGAVPLKVKSEIKTKVTGLMINKLCQTTRNALDSICISAFLGLIITTKYNNYFFIINALIGVMQVITNSMLAGVGNSIAIETQNKNYEDMLKFNFLYMWIAGWCTICLLCLYQPFIEISFGKNMTFSYYIVVAFAAYFYALKMGDIRGLYSDAAGLWWENRYRAIAESLANIILNIILVQICGVLGIIMATMISLLVLNFGFGSKIVFKYYFKNNKINIYFLKHGVYFSVTVFIACITMLACNFVQGRPIIVLMFRLLLCILIPNILYILFYRKTHDFIVAITWLINQLKYKKC